MTDINIEVEFAPNGFSHPDDLYTEDSDVYQLVEDLSDVIHEVCHQHELDGNFFIYFGGKDQESQYYKVSSDNAQAEALVAEQVSSWYQD